MNIMSRTMSPRTYPKETGIQQMSKDYHKLLPTKAVENSLVIREFGILQKRYTAVKLMPYPGSVKCGDPSVKISLAAVARKVVLAKRIFCHCKGTCTTLACRCKKASIKCSSQCHGVFANDCKNRTSCTITKSNGFFVKVQEQSTFPMFGGEIICSDKMYNLQNTCPVDSWLFIFKTLLPILKTQNDTTQLQHLLHLIEKSHFNAAKLEVAIDQKITFGRENIDFFGSEFDLMVKLYLEELYKHDVSSSCNSPYCTNKKFLKESENCPSLSIINPITNTASPKSVSEMINEWFEEESVTRCGQKLPQVFRKTSYSHMRTLPLSNFGFP